MIFINFKGIQIISLMIISDYDLVLHHTANLKSVFWKFLENYERKLPFPLAFKSRLSHKE